MKIPLQKITDPTIASSGVNLYVLRLDLNHKHISGNKWHKLKYNIEEVKRQKADVILTFGGAYSNHIAATAAAGKEFGFKTIGIIRGDEIKEPSDTLKFAESCKMKLHHISREEYRKKDSPEFINTLSKQFGNFFLLPEGGSNDLGVKGCTEIVNEIDIPFDFICCACGTGATLAGIILSLKQNQQAIGFSVLAEADFINENVKRFLHAATPNQEIKNNWTMNHKYHFGRYAKHTNELLEFMERFEKHNSIPLEHVYTGKMMFGIYDLIQTGHFIRNETIIAVHTGGLQGKLPQS